MTKEERIQLHQDLKEFYGSITEVADRAGVTIHYVRRVLLNVRNSEEVLTKACEVLKERREQRHEMQQKQARLLRAAATL